MSTDRELLEAAAKAAGHISVGKWDSYRIRCQHKDGQRYWFAPLTDDGDALRLAVDLALEIRPGVGMVTVAGAGCWEEVDTGNYTREEATRRAIVRAAAAVGANLE